MSGRDLARAIVAKKDPAAEERFFRLYGRLIEKAVSGVQYGEVGNVLPLPLFARRVGAIASRIVLGAGGSDSEREVGDPFPEAIASLQVSELYLSSAAAFGSEAARSAVRLRRSALPAPLSAAPIDFGAFDGRSPLLLFAAIAAESSGRERGCPDAASLAAHAAGGPADAESRAVAEHVRGCAACRALADRALGAAALAAPARPVTLPPERGSSRPRFRVALFGALVFLLLAAVATVVVRLLDG